MFDLIVYSGIEGLGKIREPWLGLFERTAARHFCHSYFYYLASLEGLGDKADEVSFFTVWEDGRLAVIYPLQFSQRKIAGLATKVLVSPQRVYLPFYDAIGALSAPGAKTFQVFFDLLQGRADLAWDAIVMDDIPTQSTLARELAERGDDCAISARPDSDYLICKPFKEFSESLSKNFRANLRKARNKLSGESGVEFKHISHRDLLPAALDRFVALEATGWKNQGGGTIAQRPELLAYYRALVNRYSDEPHGGFEINELWVAGQLAASQICLRQDDTLYVQKVAYQEALAKFAPGNLLLAWVIDEMAAAGDIRFVNLVTDTAWHADWRPEKFAKCSVEIYRNSMRRGLVRVMRSVKDNLTRLGLS